MGSMSIKYGNGGKHKKVMYSVLLYCIWNGVGDSDFAMAASLRSHWALKRQMRVVRDPERSSHVGQCLLTANRNTQNSGHFIYPFQSNTETVYNNPKYGCTLSWQVTHCPVLEEGRIPGDKNGALLIWQYPGRIYSYFHHLKK